MKVIKQLLSSEKFVASLGAIIIATVGAFKGVLSWTEYYNFVQIVLGVYVGGKAIQGAAAAITSGQTVKDIENMEQVAAMIDDEINKLVKEKFPGESK